MNPPLAPGELEGFRDVVTQRFGLRFDDGRMDFLADVLRQRLEALGSGCCERYLDRLTSARGVPELRVLAERLTVNETFFFRSPDNFRVLAEKVLPERVRARAAERKLHLLSVGCASGEEPYSLAIHLREQLPLLRTWEVRITAIDVNPGVLAHAARGRYSAWALRATPEDLRQRYFRKEGRDFVLSPEIRRRVAFEERNVAEDAPAFWSALRCDAVFCRNILMYFTPERAAQVVGRIRQALLPRGYLFVGHAETLRGLTEDFQLLHDRDTFFYRRRSEGGDVAALPSWSAASLESPTAWFDAIRQASERIESLSARGVAPDAPEPGTEPLVPGTSLQAPGGAPSWELALARVLEVIRQERFPEALALLHALEPDAQALPHALLVRAVLLSQLGKVEEGRATCARLLAENASHAGAHHVLALCCEQAGQASEAAEHERTACGLDPGFAMPHVHLGLAARRTGDLGQARRELGLALELLAREDSARLLLFGGGFSREALSRLCRNELSAAGAEA